MTDRPGHSAGDGADAEETGLPHSCYLLEFSVLPGATRLADVYVGPDVRALRERFEHYELHLALCYGAVLQLWVVQEGAIVEGIDLHPFLRTGEERCDRALVRLVARRTERGERWEEIAALLRPYGFDCVTALPLLTRAFELQDRLDAYPADVEARRELGRFLEAARLGRAPQSHDGMAVEDLHVDWAALAEAVPPLREPILTEGWVRLRWADPALRHPDSQLHDEGGTVGPEILGVGLNDLEHGRLD